MGNFNEWLNQKIEKRAEERVKKAELKMVIEPRLKDYLEKSSKSKIQLDKLIEKIKDNKRNIFTSHVFQCLGAMIAGCAGVMGVDEFETTSAFMLAGLSLGLGTLVNFVARDDMKKNTESLVDFVKSKTSDQFVEGKDENDAQEILAFGNISMTEKEQDRLLKDTCKEMFDYYMD